MNRFRFLVAGSATSSYGSFLNLIAFNLFVYETTGSALQTGLVMALRLLAGVVGGLLAGLVSARFALKRVMVVSALAQAGAMLSLVAFHGPAGTWLLYALVAVSGLSAATTTVALRTATPLLVGIEDRVRANGVLAIWRSLAMVGGFASAGLLVSLTGYTWAFVINAGTFVLAAASFALLPLRGAGASEPREDGGAGPDAGEEPKAAVGSRSRRRWVALRALSRFSPLVLMLIMIRSVDGFGSSAHNVGLPIQSRELDPANPAVFISTFWVTWAIGNIIAQRLTIRYARTRGAPSERAFAIGVVVMSAAFILAFTGLPTPVAVVVILLAGASDGFTENTYISRLQTLPERERPRVFGLSTTAENAAFGTGTIISAALMEGYAPLTVVGVMHGAAILAALGFLLFRRRIQPDTAPAPPPRERAPAPEDRTVQ